MQALIAGDHAVIEAHNKAVRAAVALMEKHVKCAQEGLGQEAIASKPGIFVAAAFQHELSRAKDPQLHTHVVVMNMTEAATGMAGAFHRNCSGTRS